VRSIGRAGGSAIDCVLGCSQGESTRSAAACGSASSVSPAAPGSGADLRSLAAPSSKPPPGPDGERSIETKPKSGSGADCGLAGAAATCGWRLAPSALASGGGSNTLEGSRGA
jgi:hypothetical protein